MAKERKPKDLNELVLWMEDQGIDNDSECIDFINDSISQSVKKAIIKEVMKELQELMSETYAIEEKNGS